MGEYGTYNGKQIKIGTCENMYYLRADQIDLVESETLRHLSEIRFRFPFPSEDNVQPGDFDDYDHGLAIQDLVIPSGAYHWTVQFRAVNKRILVNLPCPNSAEGKELEFHNSEPSARIVQQRVWDRVWVTVLDCGPCGARFRLPDLESAQPLLDALEREAIRATGAATIHGQESAGHDKRAAMLRTVAQRVKIGYQTSVSDMSRSTFRGSDA